MQRFLACTLALLCLACPARPQPQASERVADAGALTPEPVAPHDLESEVESLDAELRPPPVNAYHFASGGAHPRVAWFPTTRGSLSFVSVLFSTGHGEVRVFLLERADEVWAMGARHVVVRVEHELCVWELGEEAVENSRVRVTSRWCGRGDFVNGEVSSSPPGTTVRERDGGLEISP